MEKNDVINKKLNMKRVEYVVIIVTIVLALILGFVGGKYGSSNTIFSTYTNSGLFSEVVEIINEEWVNTRDAIENVEYIGVSGLVDNIGDPHTEFWTPEEALSFNQSVSGNYEGIGIGFQVCEFGAMVVSVYMDTPASEVGIEIGDIVTKVGGTSLAGLNSNEIKSLVTGDPGSTIDLVYQRDFISYEVSTNRASLDISAQIEIREVDGQRFGYILLTTFGTNTGSEVANALEWFSQERIDTLVFDFRNNGGGYLSAAKEIGNLFVSEGEPIYQMQGKTGAAVKTLATSGTKYRFENSFVLINEGTASASELVAGTLSEVADFTLIGTTTYGKGTAQTQRTLSDGSVLKFTYAQWLTSKGNSIDGVGLTPDITIGSLNLSNITTSDLSKTLLVDSVSTGVISMQNMLKLLGYDVDRTDGYFSVGTQNALMDFQRENHLTVDGACDNTDYVQLVSKTLIYINANENDVQYNKLLELIR